MKQQPMRTEAEMMERILGFAQKNTQVRAVALNGSRANPRAKKDALQDYDVVYIVSDTAPFTAGDAWLDTFGKRLLLQKPKQFEAIGGSPQRWHTFLLQLADLNRIDLMLVPVADAADYLDADSPLQILLDKDGLFENVPHSKPDEHHLTKPTQLEFTVTANEFWWVAPYVQKGLWRGQLLYAATHLQNPLHPMLHRMLGWRAGLNNNFTLNPGKAGDKLEAALPPAVWQAYLSTFEYATPGQCAQTLATMTALFAQSAHEVADALGFLYDKNEEQGSLETIRRIEALPKEDGPAT